MKRERIQTPEDLLTFGLEQGFAGGANISRARRGSRQLRRSRVHVPNGNYDDIWIPGRLGGGSELVTYNGQTLLRQYQGGVAPDEILNSLRINEKDVINQLIHNIVTYGSQTRLYEDFTPEPEGRWQYSYKIKDQLDYISLTVGEEEITCDDIHVFGHIFLICPVK